MTKQPDISTVSPTDNTQDVGVKAPENAKKGFGKFNSVEDLLQAYESLEKEFTKKSQRLKEVENMLQNESQKKDEENDLKLFKEKYIDLADEVEESISLAKESPLEVPFSEKLESSLNEVIKNRYKTTAQYAKDPDFIISAVMENDALKKSLITTLLDSVPHPKTKIMSSGGETLLTPKKRATDLEEARLMAQEFLKSQGE